jgi:hypothetical protein
MKKIGLLIVLGLLTSFIFAQRITVKESSEKLADGLNNAFTVVVYQSTEKEVEKEFRNYLKSNKAKVGKKKGEIFGENAEINLISDRPINVYAKTSTNKDNDIELSVAFDLGGAFLSSKMHSDQAKTVENILKDFSRDIAEKAFEELLKNEQRDIDKREKRYEKDLREREMLIKENEKLTQRISDNKNKVEELNKEIEEQEKDIKEKKATFEELKKNSNKIK